MQVILVQVIQMIKDTIVLYMLDDVSVNANYEQSQIYLKKKGNTGGLNSKRKFYLQETKNNFKFVLTLELLVMILL